MTDRYLPSIFERLASGHHIAPEESDGDFKARVGRELHGEAPTRAPGNTQGAKIDLDDLERKVREAADECEELPLNHRQAIALIARIRELEMALRDAASIIEGTVQAHSQHVDYHDDLDWKSAQAMRRLAAKGAVLP